MSWIYNITDINIYNMYKYHKYIDVVHPISYLLRAHNIPGVRKVTKEENEITCLKTVIYNWKKNSYAYEIIYNIQRVSASEMLRRALK